MGRLLKVKKSGQCVAHVAKLSKQKEVTTNLFQHYVTTIQAEILSKRGDSQPDKQPMIQLTLRPFHITIFSRIEMHWMRI